jgi:hypothetical protein
MVRSELSFEAMQIRNRLSLSGYVERLTYYVKESKFSRQPPNVPASRAVYRDIEHFQVGRSDTDVDEQIMGIVQQLVMSSTFPCENKPAR